MKGINLLPEELKPKSYAIRLSKDLRRFASYGLVLFLIVLMVLGGTYVALNLRARSLEGTEQNLKSQIKSYEESEQKLILVQDRLGKIDTVLKAKNSVTSLNALEAIQNNMPENVTISGVEIDPNMARISVSTDSSQNLSRFFSVVTNLEFKKVSLLSFTYNNTLGYKVELGVIK